MATRDKARRKRAEEGRGARTEPTQSREVPPALRALERMREELRFPLGTMTAVVEELQGTAIRANPAQVERGLSVMREALSRMEQTLDGLTAIEQLHAGPIAPRRKPACMGDLVRVALARLHTAAARRKVRLVCHPPLEEAWVHCDEDRILRLLGNLLGCALQVAPGPSEVHLRTWGSASEVGVEIRHFEYGLLEQDADEAEDRRVDVEWTLSEVALHLSVARTVALAHGGNIAVESQPHFGTTFSFTLPRGLAH